MVHCVYSGPRLFLSCPMNAAAAQVWFTDLWNYSIVPYMIEALRDTAQVTSLYFRAGLALSNTGM